MNIFSRILAKLCGCDKSLYELSKKFIADLDQISEIASIIDENERTIESEDIDQARALANNNYFLACKYEEILKAFVYYNFYYDAESESPYTGTGVIYGCQIKGEKNV